jgi:hypothetical protein
MASKPKEKNQIDSGDNVDQIREILFGGHLRAFDERFELVESRLARETEVLRKSTDKKVQELERLATEIREEASDHLGAEANNRDLALNKFELAMGQSRVDAENQMAAMEDRFAAELKQLRDEMKVIHKELSNALAQTDRDQKKGLDHLDQAKVARKDLAGLLTDLAQSLQPEEKSRGK